MSWFTRFVKRVWTGDQVDEPIVEMIRAAAVDPQIKNSLLMILRMDSNQRKTAIVSLVQRLKLQQAPPGLVQGLAQLENDDLAATALRLLEEEQL